MKQKATKPHHVCLPSANSDELEYDLISSQLWFHSFCYAIKFNSTIYINCNLDVVATAAASSIDKTFP